MPQETSVEVGLKDAVATSRLESRLQPLFKSYDSPGPVSDV